MGNLNVMHILFRPSTKERKHFETFNTIMRGTANENAAGVRKISKAEI